MVVNQRDVEQAEHSILRILRESGPQSSASQLKSRLHVEGIRDVAIQAAIWDLMDKNRIELTSDRKLRARP